MKRIFALIAVLSLLLASLSTVTPTKVLGTQVIAVAHADEDGTVEDDSTAPDPPCDTCGISHDLRVKNSTKGNRLFGICKSWAYFQNGETWSEVCPDSPIGTLSVGQNSLTKYGWADTDAIMVTRGYELREDVVGVDPKIAGCHDETYYKKVSPWPTDHYKSYYLRDMGPPGAGNCF